jgi:hypothetical protein
VREPTFCNVLNLFNNPPKDCLSAIKDNMGEDKIKFLASKYGDASNIGLTMGLDVENPQGVIGGLTKNLIKEQFQRTICGDRFWYNHEKSNDDTFKESFTKSKILKFIANLRKKNYFRTT